MALFLSFVSLLTLGSLDSQSENSSVQLFGTKVFVTLDCSYRYSPIRQDYLSLDKHISVSVVRSFSGGTDISYETYKKNNSIKDVTIHNSQWKVALRAHQQREDRTWIDQYMAFVGDGVESAVVFLTYSSSTENSNLPSEVSRIISSLSWRPDADYNWQGGSFFEDPLLSRLRFIALGLHTVAFSSAGILPWNDGVFYNIGFLESKTVLNGNENEILEKALGKKNVTHQVIGRVTVDGIPGEKISRDVVGNRGSYLNSVVVLPVVDGYVYISESVRPRDYNKEVSFDEIIGAFHLKEILR